MAPKKDLRRNPRLRMAGKLRVSWQQADGTSRECVGRLYDVSETGFRALLPARLEPRSYVFLRLDCLGFKASACVRYCMRSGMDFAAGLEFTGGVTFVVPEAVAAGADRV